MTVLDVLARRRVVGGSWMVAPSLLARHSWDVVARLAAEAVVLADAAAPAH